MQKLSNSEWEEYFRDNPVSDREVDPTVLNNILVEYSEEESGMEGQGDPGQDLSNVDHTPERLERNDTPEIPGIGQMALDNEPYRLDAKNPPREPKRNVNAEADPPHSPQGEIEPIWGGAFDGLEYVARRTPIVVTPGLAQYNTKHAPDPQRVATGASGVSKRWKSAPSN